MRITNLLIIASLCYSITHAQKSETILENESIYIEPEIQLGVNFDRNLNIEDGVHTSIFLTVAKNNNSTSKEWTSRLNYPKTGMRLGFTNFGNSTFGQAFTIQPFIESVIIKSFNVSVGMGLSYMNTIYDRETNSSNTNISSHLSGNFRITGHYDIMKSEKVDWRIGLTFLHFSNGRTKTPNEGLNALLLGLSGKIIDRKESISVQVPRYDSSRQTYFALRFGLGFNAISEQYNDTKLVYTFAPTYGKIINRTFKYGVGFFYRFYQHYHDYINNEEELVTLEYDHFIDNPTLYSSAFGIFGSFELLLGHIGIEVACGVNIYKPFYPIDYMLNQGELIEDINGDFRTDYSELDFRYEVERIIAGRLGLKYYLKSNTESPKNNWYLGAHINSNLGRADFLEFSIGYVYKISQK